MAARPSIVAATAEDVSLILAFIHKKAEFDRAVGAFGGTVATSEERILNTMFADTPYAHVIFAKQEEPDQKTTRPIGFALFAFRYSSFAGRPSMWLDDLYVNEDERSHGFGAALMQHLVEIARERDCTHIAWTADKRNERGLTFYSRIGAEVEKEEGNRCFWKWTSWQ